jgi:CRP-like cAMP-binding protein
MGVSMPELKAQFSVDIEHLHKLGAKDLRAANNIQIFKSNQLSSDEMLYLSLCRSHLLHFTILEPRKKLLSKGEQVNSAYFIVEGTLLGVNGESVYRFGPGSVIGLAEGIMRMPIGFDLVTVTSVQTSLISLQRADIILTNLAPTMQTIFKTIIKRTLA